MKDEEYKLIEYRNGDADKDKWTFLYNLRKDPWETENLAVKPEYAQKVRLYREKLLKHRDSWQEQEHPRGVNFWKRFNLDD